MKNLIIYTDGGSRGNPGPAAIGFAVYQNEKLIFEDSIYIGHATNNVAEYTGVLKALEWAIDNKVALESGDKISFMLDSLLVAQQLSGNFKIKSPGLLNLAIKIKNLEKKLEAGISYTSIPREQNKKADFLVNLALNKQQI